MSAKVLKTISMDLSTASIRNAIREVQKFKRDLTSMCEELARHLVKEGVEIAKMQVVSMDAVFTGYLEQSMQGVYFAEERCGYVYTDMYYALFVEYGSGYMGTTAEYPGTYPPGYKPDETGHGPEGWWYPAPWGFYIPKEVKDPKTGAKTTNKDNVKFAWTNGMIPRPFMYNTMRWLEEAAEREGIKMFRSYAG